MTTVSGSARACSRAARFGVSPTTALLLRRPSPIRSPTTTSPVAMPTRARSVGRIWTSRRPTASMAPARPAPPARRRPRALADSRNRPARRRPCTWRRSRRSARRSRRRRVIGADELAHVLGIEPGRQRGRADQVAEHHRELPALGIGWCRCVGGCRRERRRALGAEAAMAASSLRRWPSEVTPRPIRSSAVSVGQDLGVDVVVAEYQPVLLESELAANFRHPSPKHASIVWAIVAYSAFAAIATSPSQNGARSFVAHLLMSRFLDDDWRR